MSKSILHTKGVSTAESRRIFLIGFMGTGKTHWGRKWASRHHYSFFDLDESMEQEEQNSIAGIFEKKGEDYFRQKEAILLRTMTLYSNVIISCGGGAPCFFDNMSWMNKHGNTVLLQASAPFILKNVLSEKEKRPLVKNLNEAEMIFFIEQKLKERNGYYQQANLILNADFAEEASLDSFILPI